MGEPIPARDPDDTANIPLQSGMSAVAADCPRHKPGTHMLTALMGAEFTTKCEPPDELPEDDIGATIYWSSTVARDERGAEFLQVKKWIVMPPRGLLHLEFNCWDLVLAGLQRHSPEMGVPPLDLRVDNVGFDARKQSIILVCESAEFDDVMDGEEVPALHIGSDIGNPGEVASEKGAPTGATATG